jgi:hypothetical protein
LGEDDKARVRQKRGLSSPPLANWPFFSFNLRSADVSAPSGEQQKKDGKQDMAFAGEASTVIPQLRRSIDASRAAAMWLFSSEADESPAQTGIAPLADRAIAGLVRLLEKDLCVQVRFIADRAQAAHHAAFGTGRRAEDKPIGAGIGAPVRLADGRIHGMLCFFRHEPDGQLDERDVRRLEMSARLAARLIDGADAHGIAS